MKNSQHLLEQIRSSLPGDIRSLSIAKILFRLMLSGNKSFPPGFLVEGSLWGIGSSNLIARLLKLKFGKDQLWSPSLTFDPVFYRLAYQDVANSGMHPWLHYQKFGRSEGRQPHPLIDLKYLQRQIPEISVIDLTDKYLESPSLWHASTSPFLNLELFRESGVWSKRANPLIELINSGVITRYINQRTLQIGLSDLDELDSVVSLVVAHRLLFPQYRYASESHFVKRVPTEINNESLMSKEAIILPGLILVTESHYWDINPDRPAVSHSFGYLSSGEQALFVATTEDVVFPNVYVLLTEISNSTLCELIETCEPNSVLIARNERQFRAIQYILVSHNPNNIENADQKTAIKLGFSTKINLIEDSPTPLASRALPIDFENKSCMIVLDLPSSKLEQFTWLKGVDIPEHWDFIIFDEEYSNNFYNKIIKSDYIFTTSELQEELTTIASEEKVFQANRELLGGFL